MAVHSHNISRRKKYDKLWICQFWGMIYFHCLSAKAFTWDGLGAASGPGNWTVSPQWLASRGHGVMEVVRPIGATQHADFNEMMILINHGIPWDCLGIANLARILISTGKEWSKMRVSPTKLESAALKNLQAGELFSRIASQKDWSFSWQI